MRLYRTFAPDSECESDSPWLWFPSKRLAMQNARIRAKDCMAGQESAEVWELTIERSGGRQADICHVLNYGPRVTFKRLIAKVPGTFRRDEE